jgi:hypothetical protein
VSLISNIAAGGDALSTLAAQFFAIDALSKALPTDIGRVADDAVYEQWAAAADACYEVTPTTPADALALLDVILAREVDFIDEAVMKPLRLLRDGLAAMVRL